MAEVTDIPWLAEALQWAEERPDQLENIFLAVYVKGAKNAVEALGECEN